MSTDDSKLSYSVGNFTVFPTTPTSEIKAYCDAPVGKLAFDNDKLSCTNFFRGLFAKWNIHRKEKLVQEEELANLYRQAQPNVLPASLKKLWPLFLVLGILAVSLFFWLFFRPKNKTTQKVITETITTGYTKPNSSLTSRESQRSSRKEGEVRVLE